MRGQVATKGGATKGMALGPALRGPGSAPRGSTTVTFWQRYRRSPEGLLGMVILAFFVLMALAAPVLTPYNPLRDMYLADRIALPAWMGVLPQFRSLPATIHRKIAPSDWKVDAGDGVTTAVIREDNNPLLVINLGQGGRVRLEEVIKYNHGAPDTFSISVPYAVDAPDSAETSVSLMLVSPSGKEHELLGPEAIWGSIPRTETIIDSRDLTLKLRLGMSAFDDVGPFLFGERGGYRLVLTVEGDSGGEGTGVSVKVWPVEFNVLGKLHGVLGTDHMGGDLWAQFVYGARISLIIGILTAVIAVAIGTSVGIVSGYVGGPVDEFLMRVADVMLSIPMLPVLIILSTLVGKNIWNIIVLVAIFSWMGTARIVRSQTLSLKERAFVEAARAAGAGSRYIMLVHILPNVLPLVFTSLVLMVPGAIIYEATLSFLGLGDPRVATWGRMLHNARAFGGFTELAWWWVLPPGLAITLLSLSFVFIGNTIDRLLNPRYRERM